MNKENIKKVVLAYSGGLDTSIIIPWLKENYNNCEVIAVSGNVGQADELDGLEEKALATGASKLYVLDLTDEYVDEYIMPCLKAGAVYVLLGQVQNVELGSAGLESLFLQTLQLVGLADVAGNGDDLTVVVVLLQPGDDDRSIQTAGIGENDLFDIVFVHDRNLREECLCTDYNQITYICQ